MRIDLKDFNVQCNFEVHWGDMDAAQHVNNLIYLKWGESARVAYFDKMKMDTSFAGSRVGPILGWQECKYIFPMTFPDTAIVGVRTSEILEDRFILQCAVFSKRHNRIAAISRHSVIPYNYELLKKVAMPEQWAIDIKKIDTKV